MHRPPQTGFLLAGSGVALAGLVLALGLSAANGWAATAALTGWSVTTLLALGSGAWLAALHGRAPARFVAVMGAGFLARLIAIAAGTVIAATGAPGTLGGFLAGVGAAYVPLQTFEMIWFWRARGERGMSDAVSG